MSYIKIIKFSSCFQDSDENLLGKHLRNVFNKLLLDLPM